MPTPSTSPDSQRRQPSRKEEPRPSSTDSLAEEDFYYEGPYIVFTAAYHRKRGYCCGSGCRHCPYRSPE